MKKLIIVRGVPGAGKTTLVQGFNHTPSAIHSTDSFFIKEGVYTFDPTKLGFFHRQNLKEATSSMKNGIDCVIIDNTNTTFKEMEPYIRVGKEFGYDIEIVEPDTPWRYDADELFKRNTHGVPLDTIRKMLVRWQTTDYCLELARRL